MESIPARYAPIAGTLVGAAIGFYVGFNEM
jgi:hypothetical protein